VLTCRTHGVPFPRQCDLFDSLVGLAVVTQHRAGHGTLAFVGANHKLRCSWCGDDRGQLSEADANLIANAIPEFGTLDVPIALRHSVLTPEEEET